MQDPAPLLREAILQAQSNAKGGARAEQLQVKFNSRIFFSHPIDLCICSSSVQRADILSYQHTFLLTILALSCLLLPLLTQAKLQQYEKEFANLTNQDTTIRRLEQQLQQFQSKLEQQVYETANTYCIGCSLISILSYIHVLKNFLHCKSYPACHAAPTNKHFPHHAALAPIRCKRMCQRWRPTCRSPHSQWPFICICHT